MGRFVSLLSSAIGIIAFVVIVRLKGDVALVTVGAIVSGIAFAAVRALTGGS
jgi:hypothetical protein